MTLIKLVGLSILITLSFQNTEALEKTFLAPETNKDSVIKAPDKRINNFRVPMETPYDPNFWPARGRRSRRDPERPVSNENCIIPNGGIARTNEEESTNGKSPPLEFDLMTPLDLDDEQLVGSSKGYENAISTTISERSNGKIGEKIPEVFETNLLMTSKRFDEPRYKKLKHMHLPQIILYGNGMYWEPENLYGEKKKKQDVFWVARGKKHFRLNSSLN